VPWATYRHALRDRIEDQAVEDRRADAGGPRPDDLIVAQRWAETVAGLLPAGELVPVAVPFLRRHLDLQ
jgi:hypothetical protein